jgi:hypothetical protein
MDGLASLSWGRIGDSGVRVSVEYDWQVVGTVWEEGGMLHFPDVPRLPGIYRFDWGDKVYFGETDLLPRRFQHYRTPGVRQPTNLRLRQILLRVLVDKGSAEVAVITTARIEVDGEGSVLDLNDKCCRLLVENAALSSAKSAGREAENL